MEKTFPRWAKPSCGPSELNPGDVEIAAILANIYRNQPLLLDQKQQSLSAAARNKLADQVMDKMMTANPTDAKAALAHHRYLSLYHPGDAKKDLATAIKNHPEDLEVVLLAASESRRAAASARQKGGSPADVQARLEEARTHYEHAMRIAPADKRAYLLLADLYRNEADLNRNKGKLDLRAKNLDDAVATLRRGEEKVGKGDGDLEYSLAEALLAQGKLNEADKTITSLEQIIERIAPLQPTPSQAGIEANGRFAPWPVSDDEGMLSSGCELPAACGNRPARRRPTRLAGACRRGNSSATSTPC